MKVNTAVSVRHAGRSFNNDANTVSVAGYTLVDVRASYPVTEQIEVFGRLENAFDKNYQTILNFGTAGRGAFAGLRARF